MIPNADSPMPAALSAARLRQIELVLQSLEALPTLSPVAARAVKLSSSSDEGFDELVRLIEGDPALSARILSLCRRSSMGVSRNITTVRRAAVMLGWEAVQSAVLSVQIYELLGQHGGSEARPTGGAFDAPGFWKHAIAVACAAELLASHARELKIAPDEAFLAGLVHDLGKLALDWVLPKTYDKVIRHADIRRLGLAAAERHVIGIDHHQAGKRIGERWSLPLALQDVMWLHGQPAAALPDIPHRALVGLVAIAGDLAKRSHLGWSPGSHDTRTGDGWIASLGLSPKIVEEVHVKLHEAVADRCKLLGISEQSPQQLMAESLSHANARLAKMNDAARNAAAAASGFQRAVQAIGIFVAGERPGATLIDTLTRMAEGWAQLSGQAPAAVICQTRTGDDWRVIRLDNSAQVLGVDAAPGLSGPDGDPMDLAALASSQSVADSSRVLRWLHEHISAEHVTHSDPRDRLAMRHAVHAIVSPMGPAAAIIYDPSRPIPGGATGHVEQTLTTFWAWALGAAVQSEGIRRLSETMASNARELADAKDRLAEHESMARLGEFTNGAAHELNNPLTVVCGRAQVLAEKLKGHKHEDDARAIVRAAESMTDLITQLHMVSRPPAPRREAVELEHWAREVVEEARRRTGVMMPVNVTVTGDAIASIAHAALAKAVLELVANALQASPKSAAAVVINSTPKVIIVEVRDDGRGLSDHARKHAFDPFFSDQPAGRRHGLGLPLAKRIIESQGGTIELTSTPGRGTVVRFTIPVVAEQRKAA